MAIWNVTTLVCLGENLTQDMSVHMLLMCRYCLWSIIYKDYIALWKKTSAIEMKAIHESYLQI